LIRRRTPAKHRSASSFVFDKRMKRAIVSELTILDNRHASLFGIDIFFSVAKLLP